MDLAGRTSLAPHYRLYAQDPARALAFVGTKFEQLLSDHSCFYVEIRDNVLLAFRPGRELETSETIELLLVFAELVGGESKPGGMQ